MSLFNEQVGTGKYLSDGGCVECFCCGNLAFEQQRACPTCHVPLDITLTAMSRGTKPSFVPVLGASGAGKTVYIGLLLDMLSKGVGDIRGLATNALSIAIQQQTLAAFEKRQFPKKTVCEAEDWQWVHCEVTFGKRFNRRFIDLLTPDLAGESVALELEHPGSCPAVRTCVERAAAFLILVDSLRARDNGSEEDMFAAKMVTYIHQFVHRSSLYRKQVKTPISIVFTKADTCPEAQADPEAFARHNLPSTTAYISRHFAKIRYFAASATGTVATLHDSTFRPIPLHLQPHGITEPLSWAVNS